jgi:hypothetical protein
MIRAKATTIAAPGRPTRPVMAHLRSGSRDVENIVLGILLVVHLYFLYKVWSEVGFLWFLGCLVFPPLALYIFYSEWGMFRGIFFTELVLVIASALLK